MMSRPLCLLPAALLLTAATATAGLPPVTGTKSTNFDGFTPTAFVGYNPALANHGDFNEPFTPYSDQVAYDIYFRADSNYLYGLVLSRADQGGSVSSATLFSNVYFDLNPPAGNGSDFGIEVTNRNAFNPDTGASAALSASAFNYATGVDAVTGRTGIEFVLSLDYLRNDPQGLGFPKVPAGGGDVVLRLSQSFGYSIAGGELYGPNRLGRVTVGAAAVPEPSSTAMFGLAAAGVWARFRRSRTA